MCEMFYTCVYLLPQSLIVFSKLNCLMYLWPCKKYITLVKSWPPVVLYIYILLLHWYKMDGKARIASAISMHACIPMHMCVFIYIYTHTYVEVLVCVCVHASVHVCMCQNSSWPWIWIYLEGLDGAVVYKVYTYRPARHVMRICTSGEYMSMHAHRALTFCLRTRICT